MMADQAGLEGCSSNDQLGAVAEALQDFVAATYFQRA